MSKDMLNRYETLLLVSTDVTDDELAMIEKGFDQISTGVKGQVSRFDKWGKYRLAYPVNKSAYGVYVLVRFELPQAAAPKALPELESLLKIKCSEIVWRHVTVRLAADAPQTYHKPEPVDVARTNNMDSMLRENRMGNLLESVDSATGDADEADA